MGTSSAGAVSSPTLLILSLLFLWSVGAEKRPLHPATVPYDTGYIYTYNFVSDVSLHSNLRAATSLQVELLVLSQKDQLQQLSITFSHLNLTWHTRESSRDDQPFEDMDKWFSVFRDYSGHIQAVQYPQSERGSSALNVKRMIAQMLSIEDEGITTAGESKGMFVQNFVMDQSGSKKNCVKVYQFDASDCLVSVELTEDIVQEKSQGYNGFLEGLKSTNYLTLISKKPNSAPLPSVPLQVVNDTLRLTEKVPERVPLSSVYDDIINDLSCSATSSLCQKELVKKLHLLSRSDLKQLIKRVYKSFDSPSEMIALIDSLILCDTCNATDILTDTILKSQTNDEVLQRILHHFATSRLPVKEGVVNAVRSMINGGTLSNSTKKKAILTLGAMAMSLKTVAPQRSQDIVEYLHQYLNSITPSDHDAAVIDGIGNAGHEGSQSILHHYAKNDKRSNVQHAAIRALRHHHDTDTADLLQELAQRSTSGVVQHAAASVYEKHRLAKRDVITELKSRVQRSRRNVDTNDGTSRVYNITMPPVHWSTGFGDNNISMTLGRTIHNQFSLSTDHYSTDYTLSMRDETSFTVDLQLSSGIQHNQFLRTELCLDGKVSYTANMLTDFTIFGVRDQHRQFVSVVDQLMNKFSIAYDSFVSSQSSYASVTLRFSPALTSIESSFSQSSQYLSQFYTSLDSISDGISFKSEISELSLMLNSTLSNVQSSFASTKQSVPVSVSGLSYDLVSILRPNGESFIQSTSFVPLLRFAPQEALANIYQLYWNTERGLVQLESQVNSVREVTGIFGSNKEWTNPSLRLWSMNDSINDIHHNILLRINANVSEDNDLHLLSEAIVKYLQPALSALLDAPTPLHNATQSLLTAFSATASAYDLLTTAYESTRSSLDVIFGQVVHPGFPITLKPCDDAYGCGYYPSTTGSLYRDGIDLILEGDTVISPFAGYVKLFNVSSLDNSSSYAYSSNNSIVLTPTEFSMDSYTIIISNIIPSNVYSSSPVFIKAATPLGSASVIADKPTIHVEAYKSTVESPGLLFPQDPSQFLPLVTNPTTSVTWSCNEIATLINGAVVDVATAVTRQPVQTLVGDPLVELNIAHEFPQPYDLILKDNRTISSQTNVAFFESSTSLTVGPIPVSFTFTSTGHYKTNFSFDSQLLSEEVEVSLTPQVWSSVNGSMRVGSATFALVVIEGTLIDATLPLTMKQNFSTWPLVASSNMDLITGETRMNLTTKLAQLTGGGGGLSNEETLDYQVLWEYSVPHINRGEFDQAGTMIDSSPPSFISLTHRNSSSCHVEQLIGRKYHNPAFELEFSINEADSSVDKKYKAGTYPDGADVIPLTGLYRERIVWPHSLLQGSRLYFTVLAVNENGETTETECQLLNYDSSPPLGSVVPVSTLTSHPSQFLVFLSLFDESQLLGEQEIAIGTVPGSEGSDISDWEPFQLSLINTVPPGTELAPYSFPMRGRLINDIITLHTDIDAPNECANLCSTSSSCLSFDHSASQKRCVLHTGILGPSSEPSDMSFENSFSTETLKVYQDFHHYEKLGLGNSTLLTFTNLTLEDRRSFYINMRLRNRLGYTSVVSSEVVRVDLSPPLPGLILNALSDTASNEECGFNSEQYCNGPTTPVSNHRVIIDGPGSATVFNGPIQLVDSLYTKADTFMTANWDGFSDRESGIRGYTWCISSASNYSCDILSPTDPHSGLSEQYWSHTGLARTDLADGKYYITVEAINKVGYGGSLVTTVHHSVPYIVDTQPPIINALTVNYYDINTNTLNVSFIISDGSGSGISEAMIGVGMTLDDVSIHSWTPVKTNSDGVLTTGSLTVYIPDGVNGWVKLRVTDNVGLRESLTVSEPINIDRTPPLIGIVYDVLEEMKETMDAKYQSNTSHICASWNGFSDPQSLIVSYQWSVGTSSGDDSLLQLQNLTDDEVGERRACREVDLTHGMTYYSTILVTNGADPPLSSMGYSNGILIDTSPPVTGTVSDGSSTGEDIQYSNSLTSASFHWNGFSDPESSIQQYNILIHRQPINSGSRILVHTETLQGSVSSYSSNHFSFSVGDTVSATVEAVNGAGLSGTVSSNGYKIDVTPPVLTSIVDGLQAESDLYYQSSTSSLSALWSAYDTESGIAQVLITYFRVSEGAKTRVYPDPNFEDDPTLLLPASSTNHTASGLTLINGAKYIASITLRNGAGLSSTYETDGVFIDSTPPAVSSVIVHGSVNSEGSTVSTSPSEIRLDWYGSDTGSGIRQYLVSILNEDGSVAVPAIDYGVSEGGLISGLNLTQGSSVSGPFYKASVVAVDGANLSSVPVESNTFWVNAQDSAGIVQGGFDPQVDVDYTDEYYSISAHFRGFVSEDCGGFSDFLWSVGFLDDREAVLPFTEQGIVLTGEGAGSAQIYLPDLDKLGSASLLVTFRGITGCGTTFDSVSDRFTILSRPPSLAILETGPFSIENSLIIDAERSHETYQSLASFSSLFEVNSSLVGGGGEEELESVRVRIGSYPGGGNLMNGTDAQRGGANRYYIRDQLRGSQGIPNYVTVMATNKAGLTRETISQPLVLDTSLPPKGKMTCSQVLKSSCTTESPLSSMQLVCQWSGTIDPQSPIRSHTLSISTDQSDRSRLLSREIPGNEQWFVSPVLSVGANSVHYVTLYIRNEAGLTNILSSSIPSVCNSTGPNGVGVVRIRPNAGSGGYDGEMITDKVIDSSQSPVCVWISNSFLISFSPFTDEESQITEYWLGVGTYPSSDDITSYRIISPYMESGSYWYQLDRLILDTGIRGALYFTIRAFNARDQYADISSDPIYVKSDSNNINSMVYDGPNPQVDIDFQPLLTYYSGSLHYGVNCPLKSLSWGLEGADGMMAKNLSEVLLGESKELQALFTFSSNQVDLHSEETYRIVVRGVDYTDEVHILRSNGSGVTVQQLRPGSVSDVNSMDFRYQKSINSLSFRISGFGDGTPEQEVSYYEAAIGSNSDYPSTRSDIVPFTRIGLNTSHTFAGLNLVSQSQTYYVTVRAHSVSGSVAEVTSTGFRPGYGSQILSGRIVQPRYQSNTTFLRVWWEGFQSDVPIHSYEWAISGHSLNNSQLSSFCEDLTDDHSSQFVYGFENIQTSGFASANRLSLTHNVSYYIVLRVLDEANKCKAFISDAPTLIDTTPPIPPTTPSLVGPVESYSVNRDQYVAYIGSDQSLTLTWDQFTDFESSVESYSVGVFVLESCSGEEGFSLGSLFVDYVPVGASTSYTFESLSLSPNVTYVARILATNRAGLTGYKLSQPLMLDYHTLRTGTVKDGKDWRNDAVFQSDTNRLSGVFSIAFSRPQEDDDEEEESGSGRITPCPSSHYYSLTTPHPDWSSQPPSSTDGLLSSSIRYDADHTSIDINGTRITSDIDPTRKQIVSGLYSVLLNTSLERNTVSFSIAATIGENELRPHIITSVVFLDSPTDGLLVAYDQPFTSSFKAVGLQLHHNYTNEVGPHIVLWSKDGRGSEVQSVTRNVSLDLSKLHRYKLRFTGETLGLSYRRKVEVYIDESLYATLYGIPSFGGNVKMALHMFNHDGYVIPCDPACVASPPQVYSLFSSVSVSRSTGSVCDYGDPFYGWSAPIIRLEAGVGTKPHTTDVKDYEVIYSPCIPCQPIPCYQYGCNASCPGDNDPLTVSFTFTYRNDNDSVLSSSGSAASDDDEYRLLLPHSLQASVYYITVRATSASGRVLASSSNGVLVDLTPPSLSLPILHYDVTFSPTQPTSYQGNNHTISASWGFRDDESGVTEYLWAIGTERFGEDIQEYTSVDLNNRAVSEDLELVPNTVYYVSVMAVNGAGLNSTYSSNGVTYLLIELNRTMLDLLMVVDHVDTIASIRLNGIEQTVFKSARDDSAGVEWTGTPPNISTVFWYIGSEPSQTDILPRLDVSYNDAHSASLRSSVLYLDGLAFSNISELLALTDGTDPSSTGGLYFEPGRPFFHTLEFCTFAHNCETSEPRAAIVIRQKDAQQESKLGEDISLVLHQFNPLLSNASILDDNYTLIINTNGGLQTGTMLYAGFLSDNDVRRSYRVSLPYISNPYTTIDQTSRSIARRLTGVGGPSFYISLLGQDNLEGELSINVTFDTTLDWSESEPILVYWDIDASVWREVRSTCGTESKVDFITGTVSVDVCSTVLPDSDTSNRPSSLSRRRRALGTSGDGMMNTTQVEFLDRATHFVVMRFGNLSLNTAPQLNLPTILNLNEDVSSFTFTIPYTDNEGDGVWFYLTSIPRIGSATVDRSTGLLTYAPCLNCTGIEDLQIYIVERELEFGTELSDTGLLRLQVNNADDPLDIFLYDSTDPSNASIASTDSVTVYVSANSTVPVVIARVGTYDVDGFDDDLEVYVTTGTNGASSYETWLDAVAVPESLPVDWGQSPVGSFKGYISFLGVNVTYLASDPGFTGTDRVSVYSQQEDNTFSRFLHVNIEVIESWCVNGGVCNGSVTDPTCTDVSARRASPGNYTCACPSGYTGDYCETALTTTPPVTSVCPNNIPVFECGGDPCNGASCPGYPDAVCLPDYCGHCHAVWYVGGERVTCSAADSSLCKKAQPGAEPFCGSVECSCPTEHYTCPQDSVFIETRTTPCCVTYSCQCPNISCPYLMECGHGVQPIPNYYGGRYPGRCCTEYSFEDVDECHDSNVKTCSDICINERPFFSCACPSGKTLANDGRTCGVCYHDGLQYLYGDSVKIGCNWCVCGSDRLSGERWSCTADSCATGCYHNGSLYPPLSSLSLPSTNCTCTLTDTSAEWSCTLTL